MEWWVYWSNPNTNAVEKRNVFNLSVRFNEELDNLRQHPELNYVQFAECLMRSVKYCFQSKCEYEIVVSPWACSNPSGTKIDVSNQLILNWVPFSRYVYGHLWHNDGGNA